MYLSFNFLPHDKEYNVETIDSFVSVKQAKDYFSAKTDFDLILYNPYIFIDLIEKYDFDPLSFLSSIGCDCIPYANPKDIMPLSRKIEKKLIALFPPKINHYHFEFASNYKNKCVLVTGAGGSIGSELVTQLLECGVDTCLCLDISEFAIFKLKQKINSLNFENFEVIVGSIGDKNLLSTIFSHHKVDLIINASAYKHVSIMQDNLYAAINNNVLDFVQLLNSAYSFGVTDIVQISTDKAALPSNIMGFSKLLCEQILIHINSILGFNFNYSIVRFGNVVGSSGSVVPIFIDNIKENRTLCVTDNEVERYMMQISEAVSLVLHAATYGSNQTYILDMGKPFKIMELAKKTLKNTHFSFDADLVSVTGLQEGEKIAEILFTPDEANLVNKQEGIFILEGRKDSILTKSEMKLLLNGDFDFLYEKVKKLQL